MMDERQRAFGVMSVRVLNEEELFRRSFLVSSVHLELMIILISDPVDEISGDFDQAFFWEKGSHFKPHRGADFGSVHITL